MGPFSTPPFQNFQVSPIGFVPKKHSDKFRTIFHLSSLGPLTSIILLKRTISPSNILQLTMPLQQFKTLVRAATWEKQT